VNEAGPMTTLMGITIGIIMAIAISKAVIVSLLVFDFISII